MTDHIVGLAAGTAIALAGLSLVLIFSTRMRQFWLVITIFTATIAADFPLTEGAFPGGGARGGVVIWLVDFALIGLTVTAALNRQRRQSHVPFALVALTLYFTVECASAVFAPFPSLAWGQVAQTARGLLLAILLVSLIRSERDVYTVLWALAGTIAFHVLFSIAQVAHGGPFGLSILGETAASKVDWSFFERYGATASVVSASYVSGLVGAPYLLAGVLELVLPVLLSWLLIEQRRAPRFCIGIIVFLGTCVELLTNSRAGIGGLFLGFTVVLAGHFLTTSRARVRVKNYGLAALAGGVILSPILGPLVYARFLSTNLGETASRRADLNAMGFQLWESSPLNGVGLNSVATIFADNGVIDLTIHNIYVLTAAELGWLGLITWLTWVGALIVTAAALRKSSNRLERGCGIGVLGGLIAFLFHGGFEWMFRYQPTLLVLIITTAVPLSLLRIRRERAMRERNAALVIARPPHHPTRRKLAFGTRAEK